MAGYKGGMGGNMQNIMKQAQKMQEQMQEVDKQLDDWEVVGTSGGGAEGDETVVVYMNAKKNHQRHRIRLKSFGHGRSHRRGRRGNARRPHHGGH